MNPNAIIKLTNMPFTYQGQDRIIGAPTNYTVVSEFTGDNINYMAVNSIVYDVSFTFNGIRPKFNYMIIDQTNCPIEDKIYGLDMIYLFVTDNVALNNLNNYDYRMIIDVCATTPEFMQKLKGKTHNVKQMMMDRIIKKDDGWYSNFNAPYWTLPDFQIDDNLFNQLEYSQVVINEDPIKNPLKYSGNATSNLQFNLDVGCWAYAFVSPKTLVKQDKGMIEEPALSNFRGENNENNKGIFIGNQKVEYIDGAYYNREFPRMYYLVPVFIPQVNASSNAQRRNDYNLLGVEDTTITIFYSPVLFGINSEKGTNKVYSDIFVTTDDDNKTLIYFNKGLTENATPFVNFSLKNAFNEVDKQIFYDKLDIQKFKTTLPTDNDFINYVELSLFTTNITSYIMTYLGDWSSKITLKNQLINLDNCSLRVTPSPTSLYSEFRLYNNNDRYQFENVTDIERFNDSYINYVANNKNSIDQTKASANANAAFSVLGVILSLIGALTAPFTGGSSLTATAIGLTSAGALYGSAKGISGSIMARQKIDAQLNDLKNQGGYVSTTKNPYGATRFFPLYITKQRPSNEILFKIGMFRHLFGYKYDKYMVIPDKNDWWISRKYFNYWEIDTINTNLDLLDINYDVAIVNEWDNLFKTGIRFWTDNDITKITTYIVPNYERGLDEKS